MKLTDLKDADYNPRSITDVSLEGLKFAMEEFGDLSGIVHNKRTGNLVCGHQRMKGLREKHGKKLIMIKQEDAERPFAILTPGGDRFPVRVVDWPIEKEKAGNLAANNPHTQGAFTAAAIPMLKELEIGSPQLLTDLNLEPLKVDLIDAFKDSGPEVEGETDPDEVPKPPKKAITKSGDIWQLGNHRILCADSTSKEAAKLLLKNKVAAMLVTSPPYWAGQEYDDKPGIDGAREFMRAICKAWKATVRRRIIINTGHTIDANLTEDGRVAVRILLDSEWVNAWDENGWNLRHRRFWIKGGEVHGAGPRTDIIEDSCETLLTFWRVGHSENGQEVVNEPWPVAGHWAIPGVGKNVVGDDHPCPYPVVIPGRFIQIYSVPGDIVIDPFIGSGTTVIAAEQYGRCCYGTELEPLYVDVTVKRWENFTGKRAKCIKAKKTKGQGRKKGKKKSARA